MMTSTRTDAPPGSLPAPRPRRLPRSALAVLAVAALSLAAAGCMPDDARTFLDRTNSVRATHGVRPLSEHDALTYKAEAWAHHMARAGSLQHSTLSAGLGGLSYTALGENVGMSSRTSDTLLTIHQMLVASPGHRANLVDGRFTHMGVGVATDSRGRVWVAQVFARL